MSYIERHLGPNERILHRARPHWIIFFSTSAWSSLWIRPMLTYWTDEYAITNRRIVIKRGLISRHSLEINFPQIESVYVDQSLLGRLLGYGSVRIVGTGHTLEVFEGIADPMKFRGVFLEHATP